MIWNTLKNAVGLGGPPLDLLESPTRLPPYFPVEPKGCESQAQNLFQCLATKATDKARDMERVGFHQSYFKDVPTQAQDPQAAEAVAKDPDNPDFPKPTDNPLDECKTLIAYYQQCCNRKLKQKKNLILTESVRVQPEYRYQGPEAGRKEESNKAT
jgi:hypothetical protein